MIPSVPDSILTQHIGVIGKTGSGKTSTAKLIVEQVVAEGNRVCVLDPIKSDWWGLASSADGKSPGLPFSILGGPRGHLPLHERAGAAIAELVASGALPLSILDMADFGPGGMNHFFVDFAPVLLRRMKGVLYLVIEEAHEFAPKERSGMGGESMAIHYAKKLATAGRSKGIRMIVATQRVQALHNAVLGSCETMIAHRLSAPADQDPIKKWLLANASKDAATKITSELAKMKTGHAWMVSGEAGIVEQVKFPRISTFDNSATPTDDSELPDAVTGKVDIDALRSILGEAVKEAEANDPKVLRKTIADLQAQLKTAGNAQHTRSDAEIAILIDNARWDAYQAGYAACEDSVGAEVKGILECAAEASNRLTILRDGLSSHEPLERRELPIAPPPENPATGSSRHRQEPARAHPGAGRVSTGRQIDGGGASVVKHGDQFAKKASLHNSASSPVREGLDGPKQRILDALAWWATIGIESPTRVQVAVTAEYSTKGGAFMNPLGALRTAGFVEYPLPGTVRLTDMGRGCANHPDVAPTQAKLHEMILRQLDGPQRKIIAPLLRMYPDSTTRGELAIAAGYEPKGGAFMNPLGALRTLGFVDYPQPGHVVATPILFIR